MALPDVGVAPFAWGLVTTFLACVFVALRFVSRGYILRVLGAADWLVAVALLLSVGFTVCVILQIYAGNGLHYWELSVDQLQLIYKLLYVTSILYGIATVLTKVSILLLFLAVFNITTLRRITYGVLATVTVWGLWVALSNAFFCTPVRAFWNWTIPRDRCHFDRIKWFVEMYFHIALDFVIFILPMPLIRSMTIPRRQKYWLYFVFALGFCVCIVAMVRLYYMYHAATSPDLTYDNNMIIILCFVELNLSIAIPCLITLKPLVDKVFPWLLARKNGSGPMNGDGSPQLSDSVNPPTISSPTPRHLRGIEMQGA